VIRAAREAAQASNPGAVSGGAGPSLARRESLREARVVEEAEAEAEAA
jgi:hypothetical protein